MLDKQNKKSIAQTVAEMIRLSCDLFHQPICSEVHSEL